VWLGLVVLVLFTISRHEPCSDEAQAWLLARDCGWIRLVFHELRYEGNPGLWHTILWIAIHLFHLSYAAIGYVGGAIALAGLAVIVFCAPFPRVLRYPIATSFFFVYQYAVVARPYELLPLLAFGSAILFREGTRRVISFAVALSLLTFVSLHGAVIAIALAVAFAVRVRPLWSGFDRNLRKRVITASTILCLTLLVSVLILFPPHTTTSGLSQAQAFSFSTHYVKMLRVVFDALSEIRLASVVILSLVTLWLLERRGVLLFLIAVGGTAFIFGFLWGTPNHEGIILIALLTAIWSVWPTMTELKAAPENLLNLHKAMIIALSLMFVWQSYWSVVAIRNDWRWVYSGAKDAALYLKSVHAETAGCRAYGYHFVGVQPYFDHNIFANLGGPGAPAYYHNAVDFDQSVAGFSAFKNRGTNPPCLLIAAGLYPNQSADEFLHSIGAQEYELVHTSEGSIFFKDYVEERQIYWFFVRRPSVTEILEQKKAQQ